MKPAVHVGIDGTTWSNDRGFGRFTREFVTALAQRKGEFRYSLVFDRPPESPVPDGVDQVIVGTHSDLNEASRDDNARSFSYLFEMGRAVRKQNFDLFFYPAVYSYFPLFSTVPKVVCYHDATAERLPEFLFPTKRNHFLWQIKTRLAIWQTRRAMTVSQSSARDLESILRIPPHKIDVVTEAADPMFRPIRDLAVGQTSRDTYGIPRNARLFVYVGGMNAHKNILGLLKALPDVVAEDSRVHLAIVGSISGKGFWDNVPELKDYIAACPGLEEHVTFTGYISDENLVELFAGTDALVFPSLWEGFGLPAVEAMSCGVPVLASDRGSLPEVIGNAGLFFDPQNQAEIRDTLLRFLRDEELAATLRSAAVTQASKFTWRLAAELGEDCFRKALA
ncbi:MAG: glycosyltransferase family 4 protein [Silicimonas sp.]|nr:glycosyltransferase family 4 protein [Silicimonas sp.]